ncbi:dephospho-CoA kinase [Alkalinema sp. FACHB-956]|uniref:dephospho-CoA kinase n=1 Tax=Alkalinema sp. FACHB-956 TaxID=2692768 RepID=UPI0032205A46
MNSRAQSTDAVPPAPRIIGLTGGIAMGKTTVSNYLAQVHHLPVLDADLYAREAVAPGSPILAAIADRYGATILNSDGSLDRKQLGTLIFTQPQERQWLEQQIHPFVRQRLQVDRDAHLQADPKSPVVLVIPLLFEAAMTDLVTEIWVIYCPRDRQIQRLMERENLSSEQAIDRIQSQMDIQEKCNRADLVLDNSLTIEGLFQAVDRAVQGIPPRTP